jgi:hypothetical protein
MHVVGHRIVAGTAEIAAGAATERAANQRRNYETRRKK